MRDKRAIIIRSPQLQKIRNNLRNLFYQFARSEREKKYDKWRGYLFNSNGSRRSIDDLSPVELRQFRRLQGQENQITSIINRSILKCVTCGKADRDMTYNKAYNAWYCIECYSLERTSAQERAKVQHKDPKSCEEKAIEEHSKTFL